MAVLLATALFINVSRCADAHQPVSVQGVPGWLEGAVQRSLAAVLANIPQGENLAVKEKLLRVVGEKLFEGYRVDSVHSRPDAMQVSLSAVSPVSWDVQVLLPSLSAPVSRWFSQDIEGLEPAIEGLLEDLPLAAFSWCDTDFRKTLEALCRERLPGWRISLVVRVTDGMPLLQVSFIPEQPLTLAVDPHISSRSLPSLLYGGIREDMLKDFSPVIGLPVVWVERHRDALSEWSQGIIARHDVVRKARVKPKVQIRPAPLSTVNVELESHRFVVDVWLAAYLGNSGRYPEIGLHLGRRAQIFPHHEFELYGEWIATVDDWRLETRLGVRTSPWGDVWVGGEWSNHDDRWWMRLGVESRVMKPYGWLRFNEDGYINTAAGWRFTDYFSIELHYDSRDERYWSIRAISNL